MGESESVFSIFGTAVNAWPESMALRDLDADKLISYRDLWCEVSRLRNWLSDRGVSAGQSVAIRAESRWETVALMWAVLAQGAVFVPINPSLPPAGVRRILADAAPALFVNGNLGCDGQDSGVGRPFPEMISLNAEEARKGELWPAEWTRNRAMPSKPLCFIIYTSGTTAQPKGVMAPHSAVLFVTKRILERLNYRSDDIVLVALPLAFDYGLYQILLATQVGACVVLRGARGDHAVLDDVEKSNATIVPVVPSLAQILTLLCKRRGPVAGVRLVTNTGAALRQPYINGLHETFPDSKLALMYGITECKRVSILEPDGYKERPGSVGRPLDGTHVAVVSSEGIPLEPYEVGELHIRGPHVMDGYWRDPEETALRFTTNPISGERVLRTGDHGFIDDDGHLHLVGRSDEIFKHRGVRMNVQEIEAVAAGIPGISEAAIVPPDVECGRLTLVVVASDDITDNAVLAAMATELERAKLPDEIVRLPLLPLTVNGKVDKSLLRSQRLSVSAISAGDSRDVPR